MWTLELNSLPCKLSMAGKQPKLKCRDRNDDDSSPGDAALSMEKLNLGVGPRKKLLVLGLHGLLVMRFHTNDRDKIPKSRGPDARYGPYGARHWVYKRPFIDQFLNFCCERFDVAIWSSSMEHNVNAVLDCAIGEMRSKLLFVWDHRKSLKSGYLDAEGQPLYFKQLKKISEDFKKFPIRGMKCYSASDTLFITHDPFVVLLNPPSTSIFPDLYNAEDGSDNALDPKGDLVKYLEGLASSADDVPSYVKAHPFGQPAITPNHPLWPFCSRVLRHLEKQKIFVDETC